MAFYLTVASDKLCRETKKERNNTRTNKAHERAQGRE